MDPAAVIGLLYDRMHAESAWMAAAEQVIACYEGRLRTVEAEVDEVEDTMVANLMVLGIDQTGMRIASTLAQTRFFPERPGKHASEERARDRAAAMKGLHNDNAIPLLDRKRARWFVALAKAPVLVRPLRGRVTWEPRDPLSCFPAPSAEPDGMVSDNCVFSIRRPWWWCMQQPWADSVRMLRRPESMDSSEEITIVEYVDSETWGMYAAAPDVGAPGRIHQRVHGESYHGDTPSITRPGPGQYGVRNRERWVGTEDAVTLVEGVNRAGLCPVITPRRITLGGLQGQFDQMVSVYRSEAKLAALQYNAIVESVFPPLYAIERENEQLEVTKVANAKRGELGEIRGGTLMPIQLNPGFQVFPQQDRLERAQRLNGGIPGEYGGESGNNIRTARRGEQVLAGVIDFPIQEAQECFERSRWHENHAAIAVGKGWFGAKTFYFGAAWRGRGKATFTFDELWPTDESTHHEVKYPYAGADLNGQLIRVGQKMGLELISKQTAREDDPEIDNPELEKDRIDIESLEAAMRGGIQQQLASGAMDPGIAARMIELIASDRLDLVAAYQQANREAQELQAQQVPAGSPELMPGAAGPAAITPQEQLGPPAALSALTQELGALRLGQRSSPQEQRAEVAAALGAG